MAAGRVRYPEKWEWRWTGSSIACTGKPISDAVAIPAENGYITRMLGFLIKKSFYDMWDNMLLVILLNFGFFGILGVVIGAMYGLAALSTAILAVPTVLGALVINLIAFAFSGGLISVYAGACACLTRTIADYEKPVFGDFITGLKKTWRPSLLFGLLQGALIALILNAASVYLASVGNLFNWLLFFVLFWIYLTWLMASQYFFALQARFDQKLFKNIRKMFILFFDNTLFTMLALSFVSLIVMGISFFLFLVIPGFAGILLLQAVALKLRALKYDYLDAHPQAKRRKIPWQTLLAEDRERVGKRTLKGMFMPWKE
jgi:uncharacterized membrane protein YesL